MLLTLNCVLGPRIPEVPSSQMLPFTRCVLHMLHTISTLQADGTWCLVLEHCGRGTLDMLIHHSRSPLARAPHPLPPPPPAAAAAGGSHAPQQQQQQQLTRPDVVKLLPLMRGVVRGLVHLHSRKPAILHRDVKPANIMIGHGMQVSTNILCDKSSLPQAGGSRIAVCWL
jgi:serine/threonine protein kinase